MALSPWKIGVTALVACGAPQVPVHHPEPLVIPSPEPPAPKSAAAQPEAPRPPPIAAPAASRGSRAHMFELLAPGTAWETEVHLITGSEPGPMVVVVAGVHGDEPAGPAAAESLLYWTITRGRMYVVPRANVRAIERGTRRSPKGKHRDLNRNFPLSDGDAPRGILATALWDLVARVQPDLLVDLHEGFDFNRSNPKSVGSSVLYNPWPNADGEATRLLDAVNPTIDKPWRHFTSLRSTAPGSLARAARERLGSRAFIFETTKSSDPVTYRITQHLLLLERLLRDNDMDPDPGDTLTARCGATGTEEVVKPDGVR